MNIDHLGRKNVGKFGEEVTRFRGPTMRSISSEPAVIGRFGFADTNNVTERLAFMEFSTGNSLQISHLCFPSKMFVS